MSSQSKTSCPQSNSVPPHRASNHALPPFTSMRVSMNHPGQRTFKNKYESNLRIGPWAPVPLLPPKKATQELVQSKHIANELKRITHLSQDSLKSELLDIHRREKPPKKKKKKKKSVHPVFEQKLHLEEPTNALTDIATRIDLGSYSKDYIRLSKEHKKMEKYRVCSTKRDTSRHHACCVHCSRRKVQKVFFPCEHGACNICLNKQTPKQCPLCNGIIRIVLDQTGNEHDEYWKWVEEVSFLLFKFHVCQQKWLLLF